MENNKKKYSSKKDTIREIVTWYVKESLSRNSLIERLVNDRGFSETTANAYVIDALNNYAEVVDNQGNRIVNSSIPRFEQIYEDAMKKGRLDTALKALAKIAEIQGEFNLVREVKNINYEIKFGDED